MYIESMWLREAQLDVLACNDLLLNPEYSNFKICQTVGIISCIIGWLCSYIFSIMCYVQWWWNTAMYFNSVCEQLICIFVLVLFNLDYCDANPCLNELFTNKIDCENIARRLARVDVAHYRRGWLARARKHEGEGWVFSGPAKHPVWYVWCPHGHALLLFSHDLFLSFFQCILASNLWELFGTLYA